MKINSENCEAWFLDYYEGNLSEERAGEMFAFLEQNPEMQELFDSYEPFSLQPDKQVSFDGKADLKKPEHSAAGIGQSNYEEYFVSYVEGMLNADEKKMVDDFLLKFPSHRQELELLKLAVLTPDEKIVFEQKDALKKTLTISEENFDEMAIASVEGLLTREEEKSFSASLSHNEAQQRAYTLYRQAKLSPDTSIVFEDKESLKRKERGAFWRMTDVRFAAAAAVVLLLGILYWNYSGSNAADHPGNDLAKKESAPKKDHGLSTPGKDPLANNNSSSGSSPVIDNHTSGKHIASRVYSSDDVQDNKTTTIEHPEQIASHHEKLTLASNVNPQVDFSDAYYSAVTYSAPAPAAASNSISPRQAAMRWMKKQLDRTAVHNADEDPVYTASSGNPKDVNGFDLTSSAVSALGNATGANLRLDHEQAGTVLTVGKYELFLNRNN